MKIPYSSLILAAAVIVGAIPGPAGATATRISVMAANITSDGQKYGPPGIRCFQGLAPDIVLIQEFNPPDGQTLEQFVMTAFDSSFEFYCEPTGSIPNGIISRYPILSSGYWTDSQVPDRNFVWAVLDIPGEIDLQCVSGQGRQ